MQTQTTSSDSKLESKLESLEQKAEEYDARTNTEKRVEKAEDNIAELNQVLKKLDRDVKDLEKQVGILTEVFEASLPTVVKKARDEVRTIAETSQEDIVSKVADSAEEPLSVYTEQVRSAREAVSSALGRVNERLKEIQRKKLSAADTAESIQKIVGQNPQAMDTIDRYRTFLNTILDPKSSVSQLKSQWQGIEKAFKNLDTDWDAFQKRHSLSDKTIRDLKTLSDRGQISLDDLETETVVEMMEVPELRSAMKVSL